MFKAINSEDDGLYTRNLQDEQTKIEKMYLESLKGNVIDEYIAYSPKYECNIGVYRKGKIFLMCSYIRNSGLDKLDSLIDTYDALIYKDVLFEAIEKYINGRKFFKAKKLLNLARDRKFLCNRFYELERLYAKKYYYIPS